MFTTHIEKFTSQNYTDFQAEASTLGLAPGEWPEEIVVIDGPHTLTAHKVARSYDIDCLRYVLYADGRGHQFVVFND